MIARRFFEPLLAHASYLIGCSVARNAIVIDPHRDADFYIRAAAQDGLAIAFVTETHIHADYLSGSRELAHRTGATLLLSGEGPAEWQYAFAGEGRTIGDGDRESVGNVAIDVLHTPGHTPEHLTFLITDGAVANQPIAAATGDFIFVGDVGRPDLLERAAAIKGTMEQSARTLFRSLRAFDRHEEWLQIWPGHGAGSACGKGISAVPHSTLGYERRFNWAFQVRDENEFVAKVLEGQPDPPKYFAMMKQLNKAGPRVLGGFSTPPRLEPQALESLIAGGNLVVDVRSAAEYASGFLVGTVNLPLSGAFLNWAGWFLPYDRDIYLLLPEGGETRLAEAVRALALIGIDRVAGYFVGMAPLADGHPLATIPQLQPRDVESLHRGNNVTILDVRTDHEWHSGHLPGATHIPLGYLPDRVNELPRTGRVIVHCQAGARSAIAASLLRRAGIEHVSNLVGGLDAWQREGLPL